MAQEGMPAVCIPVALLVILLLFVSYCTTEVGFSNLLCSF